MRWHKAGIQNHHTRTPDPCPAAGKLSRANGTPVGFVNIGLNTLWQRALANGLPEIVVQAFADLYASCQKGKLRKVTGTVKELTGKEPRKIIDFFRKNNSEFRK
jgi:hypothetical protein